MPVAVGGGGDAGRHLRRIVVGPAIGRVVQIVELADRGEPGFEHLDIELRGDRLDIVWRQLVEEAVHHLPPGPEAVAAGTGDLGEAGHAALEGVAVQVGHAGQWQRRVGGDRRRPVADRNAGDPSVAADVDGDIASAQPVGSSAV